MEKSEISLSLVMTKTNGGEFSAKGEIKMDLDCEVGGYRKK